MNNTLGKYQDAPVNPATTSRRSHMDEWLDNLAGVAKENENLASELEIRLQCVARSQAPAATCGSQPAIPQEYLVPMADAVRSVVQTIERNNAGHRDLLSRIEA